MKSKIAIYCRVSTAMQSTDRQKEELKELAKNKEILIDENLIFVDVYTGFSVAVERPQYAKLLKEIDKGNVSEIWFSELTRLGRSSSELLSEIERLQKKKVELYFKKENLWVRNENQDIGSRILLAVLSVTSTYEIELFAERTMTGKIDKIKGGGGVSGDSRAYGYKNVDKKIVVRDDEAVIVKRIFEMYASGKSVVEICDILNSDKSIPSPFAIRMEEYKKNREKKGLAPKEYPNINVDNLKWRQSTISRMLSNELYKGYRETIFHKPRVDKLENKENKNEESEGNLREIVYEYKEHIERLRIVSDELFQQVQDRLSKAKYNKNNSIKHENLLKAKLVCGECGSNFSVGKQVDNTKRYTINPRSYKCYGRVNRPEHPRICTSGAEILQWRLDGLVLQLSLWMFTEKKISTSNELRIEQLSKEIEEHERMRQGKEQEFTNLTDEHKNKLKILLNTKGKSNPIISELIDEEIDAYENKKRTYATSISKLNKEIASKRNLIERLRVLSESIANLYNKMHEIRSSRELVKDMMEEYVDKIEVFKISKLWNLIIVKYVSGDEVWGTIKNARYKNSEMFYDETLCRYGVEFKAWMLNNSEHCFRYDKDSHTISYNGESNIYTEIPSGTYSYNELDKILNENMLIGSFPFYAYEETSLEISPKLVNNGSSDAGSFNTDKIDWVKHNEEVLMGLAKKNKSMSQSEKDIEQP